MFSFLPGRGHDLSFLQPSVNLAFCVSHIASLEKFPHLLYSSVIFSFMNSGTQYRNIDYNDDILFPVMKCSARLSLFTNTASLI